MPPDPEDMNDSRAAWALAAVRKFQDETGTDDGDAFTDLICDLRHLADRHPEFGTVAAAFRRAAWHYEEETEGGDLLRDAQEVDCGQCEGTGTTDAMGYEEECPVCDGSGMIPNVWTDRPREVECSAPPLPETEMLHGD